MVVICTAVCALVASSAIVMVMFHGEDAGMSDRHRAAREAFFGSDAANQPMPKGQEMRPRW